MLDKLKSLFFEKVEKDANVNSETTDAENLEAVESKPNIVPPIRNVNNSEGKVDDKLLGVLAAAIRKANIDGFDYLEYKESIKSLEKMDMSESTRFQSAFAMAKTMGANPQRLIQSAEYYLGILDEEGIKFGGVIENQRRAKIGDKGERIKQMEELVQQKLHEIERIKKEIEQLNTEIETENNSMAVAQQKIEQTKMNFESSFQQVYSTIKNDIEKMKSYLK